MIFISHATPEDNEFTRWLALRLAKEGYPVWCDLTKLLGGEDFWKDIESAIRNGSTKFVYVLSRHSNEKEGTLQELSVAKQVAKMKQDFIIPVKVDDLPYSDTNIQLQRLNCVDFTSNWMTGLGRLLEKLQTDEVPKDQRFNPSSVANWWRDQMAQRTGVRNAKESYASNWFKIGDLPDEIHLHSLENEPDGTDKELPLGIPNYRFKGGVFCFEHQKNFSKRAKDHGITVTDTEIIKLDDFRFSGYPRLKIQKPEARNIVTYLLRRAFEAHCQNRGLIEYALSGESRCFWYPENFADGNKIEFTHLDGRKTYRRMVGYKTLQPRDGMPRQRTWHFAIQPKVIRYPELSFAIKSHVVFSEDGKLYESKARQHSARRGQCKLWHNDTWLDRMLAAMSFLSDPVSKLFITIPCGTDVDFSIQTTPLLFESPVSYEPEESGDPPSPQDDPVNDLDEEEEEEPELDEEVAQ
jgi:hypothetical protein